VRLQARVCGA